jgi:hypothetical protein
MELYSTLSNLFTVISFLVFLGIVAWAYGRRRDASLRKLATNPSRCLTNMGQESTHTRSWQ